MSLNKVDPITITAQVAGRGLSGQAFRRIFALAGELDPEISSYLAKPIQVEWMSRDPVALPKSSSEKKILAIANPHALHAPLVSFGLQNDYDFVFCEKPAVTSLAQLQTLSRQPGLERVSIMHGYRATWGISTIQKWIQEEALGALIDLEVRYLQSSVAQELLGHRVRRSGWKDDVNLSGGRDVLLDLVPHAVDLIWFLGGRIQKFDGSLSARGASASHRDCHGVFEATHQSGLRSYLRVSKIEHGQMNALHVRVLGEKGSLEWRFQEPDRIVFSSGAKSEFLVRNAADFGLSLPPFHGAGWLDGYAEIIRQGLRQVLDLPHRKWSSLSEHLEIMEVLLRGSYECRD